MRTIPLTLRLVKRNARVAHSRSGTSLDAGLGKTVTRNSGTIAKGRLAGKVALITGGGTGIGKAIALAFAREGARVAAAGRRLERVQEVAAEIDKQGGTAMALRCDATRAKDAEQAVKDTAKKFGRLDVLVNNAGILSVATIDQVSEEEWDQVMTVNLKGPFLMSRAALREFRKGGGGAIVNIGSILGLVAMKDRAAYCASKGGVTLLTKAMALDHAHEHVRVNCICPSIVETELVKGLFDNTERGQALRKNRMASIPLGRFGKPLDVAELAVFLASEESSWLTGAAIPLDGGLTAY